MKKYINSFEMGLLSRALIGEKCFKSPISPEDLLHTSGSDNTGGIQQEIAWAFLEDIDILPEPDANDSAGDGTFSQLVTITQNVRFKPYKKAYKLYVTLEKGAIESDSQGEYDGMSYMNKLKFYHPGQKAAVLGFAQVVKNANVIFWVKETDGQVRQVGHRGYPAKMVSAPSTTGNKTADSRGIMFEFHSARKGPAPIFAGRFDLMGSGFESGTENDYQTLFQG